MTSEHPVFRFLSNIFDDSYFTFMGKIKLLRNDLDERALIKGAFSNDAYKFRWNAALKLVRHMRGEWGGTDVQFDKLLVKHRDLFISLLSKNFKLPKFECSTIIYNYLFDKGETNESKRPEITAKL